MHMRLGIIILLSVAAWFLIPLSFPDLIPHHHEQTHHEHPNKEHHEHHHSNKEVDPTLPLPSVTLRTEKDLKGGYNIFIETEYFTFVPEKASTEHAVPNEWHAHLYVDHQKVGRVYGNAYHIPEQYFVQWQEHTISITLSAHTHEERSHNWHPIWHTLSLTH